MKNLDKNQIEDIRYRNALFCSLEDFAEMHGWQNSVQNEVDLYMDWYANGGGRSFRISSPDMIAHVLEWIRLRKAVDTSFMIKLRNGDLRER